MRGSGFVEDTDGGVGRGDQDSRRMQMERLGRGESGFAQDADDGEVKAGGQVSLRMQMSGRLRKCSSESMP